MHLWKNFQISLIKNDFKGSAIMKKARLKVFSIIVAVIVLLSCFSMCAVAKEPEPDGYVVVEGEDVVNFSPEVTLPKRDNITDDFTANKFYGDSIDPDSAYLFYDQLSDSEQVIYSKFLLSGVAETFQVQLEYQATGATVDAAITNVKAIISKEVKEALTAAVEDNPYYFWMSGYGYSFNYYQYSTTDGYGVATGTITIRINIDTNSYTDYADVEEKLVALVEAVEAAPVNGITRYEKVKSIHDYIYNINEYPEQQGTFSDGSPWYGPMAHQPTGVFLNGYAVCEGYAEAMKLLCDREGIPCITVLGTGNGGAHKWNYVKMEDGLWYLIDATWNDQSANVFYDYFLTGADTVAPHFAGSAPDSQVHVPDGAMFSGVTPLQYPTLASDHYGKVMLSYNAGDITVENSMNVIFIGKDITTLEYKLAIPSGFTGSLSSYTDLTGGTLTTKKTSTGLTKTYIFAKRGDIDGSNTTNTTDYNKVVAAAKMGACPMEYTAEYYAGDINHDGAIDGFDAITLDLYLQDTIDFN